MKNQTIFIFLFLLIGLFGFLSVINSQEATSEGWNRDQYGKVSIKLIDPVTNEPVNELFKVIIFNSLELSSQSFERRGKTDQSGMFSTILRPGYYYFQFLPESPQSIYALQPSPILSEINRERIQIEPGKITKVIKEINTCGKLEVLLVDPNGNRINPGEKYNMGVSLSLKSFEGLLGSFSYDSFSPTELSDKKDNFNDGQSIFNRLHPGEKYSITVKFGGLGYNKKVIENIKIHPGQTTTQNVVLDLNDPTGIEGYIKDQNGVPLEDVLVFIDDLAIYKSGKKGYYKLVGIKEGKYFLTFKKNLKNNNVMFKVFDIEIVEDVLLRKDFVFMVK